jgi:hypothetical protein
MNQQRLAVQPEEPQRNKTKTALKGAGKGLWFIFSVALFGLGEGLHLTGQALKKVSGRRKKKGSARRGG